MGTKNNPGRFDCYAEADPDEPLFTLLAHDPLASGLVALWAALRVADSDKIGPIVADLRRHASARYFSTPDLEKAAEAMQCASDMVRWRLDRVVDPLDMPTWLAELLDRAFNNPPDGKPPSSDTRIILAAIKGLAEKMTDITQAEADETAAVNSALAEFKVLSGELVELAAELKDALANGDQAAVAAAAKQFESSAAALNAGVTAAIAADPNTPPPPPPALTLTPTSITGVAGQAVSGNFEAADPTGANVAGSWAFTDAPPDITFNADGSYSGTPAAAEAGDMNVAFTPAPGGAPTDIAVSYTITAAPAP